MRLYDFVLVATPGPVVHSCMYSTNHSSAEGYTQSMFLVLIFVSYASHIAFMYACQAPCMLALSSSIY